MRSAIFRPRGKLRPRRPLEGKPVEGRANHAPYFLAALAALLILPFLLGVLWGPEDRRSIIIGSKDSEIGSSQPQPEQEASVVRYVVVPSEEPTVPTNAIPTGGGGQQQQHQSVVVVLP